MRFILISIMATLVLGAEAGGNEPEPPGEMSVARLEQQLEQIDAELSQLASYSMRSGIGTAGHRSKHHLDPHQNEWVMISLKNETLIDQIVLTPLIRRDTQLGLHGDGFPAAFRIVAGTKDDPDGTIIASYSAKDHLLPRIAPVRIDVPACSASWIRLEATELSSRDWDNQFILQLSEIMVFSGSENVALNRPVQVSSSTGISRPARHKGTVVDGQVPYLMDAASGEKSIAFMSNVSEVENPTLTIDLGESYRLNRIHLHTAELSDTIPQSAKPAVGVPLHFRLEGAEKPDFSDAAVLAEYQRENIFDAGPIIMMNFPATRCRHIRLIILESYSDDEYTAFGCAELELFSDGENVARGKKVALNYAFTPLTRTLDAITDGRNLYGKILPLRGWMEQLARRHTLETLRPSIDQELNRRYIRQKKNIQHLGWLAGLLAAGSVLIIVREQFVRQKTVFRVRERIAANLHDELGANLHAISLLSDTAEKMVKLKRAEAEWSDLIEVISDVRDLSEETGSTARYCTNLLEANELKQDLAEYIRRTAERLLADLNHDLSISGNEFLNRLKPRARIDLILFYKECLTNIIRHSGATDITTHLTADKRHIQLSITDNGQGLDGKIPTSLKRRARLLGAKLEVGTPRSGGTAVILRFNTKRKMLRSNFRKKQDSI